MCEDYHSGFGIYDLFERVLLYQKPLHVNLIHLAYQLFGKMLLRVRRKSQHIQLLKLSKSWHFKYKNKTTRGVNLWFNGVGGPKDTEVEQLIPEILGHQVYLFHAEKRLKRWLFVCGV